MNVTAIISEYKPLTPLQQEKYNHRNDEKKPVKKVEPVAEKKEEKVENVEEPTVEMKVDEVNAAISLENTTKVEAVSAEEAEKIEETPVFTRFLSEALGLMYFL